MTGSGEESLVTFGCPRAKGKVGLAGVLVWAMMKGERFAARCTTALGDMFTRSTLILTAKAGA